MVAVRFRSLFAPRDLADGRDRGFCLRLLSFDDVLAVQSPAGQMNDQNQLAANRLWLDGFEEQTAPADIPDVAGLEVLRTDRSREKDSIQACIQRRLS